MPGDSGAGRDNRHWSAEAPLPMLIPNQTLEHSVASRPIRIGFARLQFALGLLSALLAAGLLGFGMIESGPALVIALIGLALIAVSGRPSED